MSINKDYNASEIMGMVLDFSTNRCIQRRSVGVSPRKLSAQRVLPEAWERAGADALMH